MKVYYLVFIITLLLSFVLRTKTDKHIRWKLFILFLPLFIFAAIRVDFGNDYENYELYFEQFHIDGPFRFNKNSHAEIGYQFLCYIMPSYRSMLVLNAFLLCLSLGVFLYRNIPQKFLWLAILLIFLNPEKNIYGNLVGMRNGFVVTSFLLGSVFVQHRSFLQFLVLTVLLSTIHTAALLFMPIAYFVGRNTMITKKEVIIWIIIFAVLLSFTVSGLMDIVSPFISQFFDRYEYYVEDFTAHRGILLTGSSLFLTYLIFLLYYNQKIYLSKEQNSLVRLGLLYVATAFLGSLAIRANYFYDMYFIGTVIVLSTNSKNKIWGATLAILALLMSAYSMRLWQTNSWVAGNPLYFIYSSIWGTW